MNNIFNMVSQAMQNPMAVISKRFNIPQGINTPQDMVQHLLDTRQISQEQLNAAMKNSTQMRTMFHK